MFDVLKIEFKRIQEEFYYLGKLQGVGALTKSNNRYNINLTCRKILKKKTIHQVFQNNFIEVLRDSI